MKDENPELSAEGVLGPPSSFILYPSSFPADLPRNIALIGFMGSGKSTVGRSVARRLGWQITDTDTVVETAAGRAIPQVFAEEGEAAFRDREASAVLSVCRSERQVIATGGGAVLRRENADALRNAALVIWLTARPDVVVARTERRAASRPLLTPPDGVDLLTHVLTLLGERAPAYQSAAHLVVDTSDRAPDAIAVEIIRKAQKWVRETQTP